MKWLQGALATRFNRYRGENGHVFQGRYKAILIGGDRSLLDLVDYIHLNPVRTGLCNANGLPDHKLSSYPKFWERTVRDRLELEAFLSILGVPNNLAGMKRRYNHTWS